MHNTPNLSLPVASLLFLMAFNAHSGPPAPENPWSFALSLGVTESYDSNVYLQDVEPLPANVAAARAAGFDPVEANHGSFVTSIQPKLELNYQSSPAFKLSASYAPEIAFYHNADSEDHVAHRSALNFGGIRNGIAWELNNAAIYIDGDENGPVFARPGDIPAIGGIPLRDRREALILRDSLKMTIPMEDFFLRPLASFYYHDFRTGQRASGTGYAYENYIDRLELSAGMDLGYRATENTALVLGYRYGGQSQYDLLGKDSPYDNRFHRILVGVEGAPFDWLKLAVLGGPDIREFSNGTPANFDRDELLYYIDGTATVTVSPQDSLTFLVRRYEQPAFSSHSMYEDITYSANWKHKMGDHWSAGAGFRAYGGDWQAPVEREDWIFTPSASVIYARDAFTAELGYSYDWVDNVAGAVPGTPTAFADGREFTRSIVSLSGKYSF